MYVSSTAAAVALAVVHVDSKPASLSKPAGPERGTLGLLAAGLQLQLTLKPGWSLFSSAPASSVFIENVSMSAEVVGNQGTASHSQCSHMHR
jgi:hypothetical protein